MSKTLRNVRRVFWIATTPLALTFLLASPARAQHGSGEPAAAEHEGAAHEGAEHEGGHHGPPANPVQNFASFDYKDKDSEGG